MYWVVVADRLVTGKRMYLYKEQFEQQVNQCKKKHDVPVIMYVMQRV